MELLRLKYIGRKSLAKLYFNRKRFVFNRENNFINYVPRALWGFVKQTNEFMPAPETVTETSSSAGTVTVEVPEKTGEFVCEICGYEAKSSAGLAAHKRFKHKKGKAK